MKGLITDRTQRNVYRRKELSTKGWAGMTTEEKAEWLGDPFAAVGANLFKSGEYYGSTVALKYWSEEIVATALIGGTYLYAVSIIGKASDFENQVLTLSAETITPSSAGTPKIEIYWHDNNGIEWAGGTLLSAGSATFNTADHPNIGGREYLAAYVYVTAHTSVTANETATFGRVMLEKGSVSHLYTPYTEILPTLATKGAYNYSDLNRVERAVAEISDRKGLGLTTKMNWAMWDIPTEGEMSRYLRNISAIRQNLPGNESIPSAPITMNNFTYVQANNIELILSAAYESLTK